MKKCFSIYLQNIYTKNREYLCLKPHCFCSVTKSGLFPSDTLLAGNFGAFSKI